MTTGQMLSGASVGEAHEPRAVEEEASRFDFRRPSTFAREHVRSLEVAHEVFQRRFASRLSSVLRTAVQLEPLSAEQMSYDDYIRSTPNPTVLTTVALSPLPDMAILETNVHLALLLVDRLLGGRGVPVAPRRPTEVETFLIRQLMGHAQEAFRETLEPFVPVTPELVGIDYNPQLVQIVAPSEVVLLLTYRLAIGQGSRAEGLVTVCYPFATLSPVLDRLANSLWMDNGPEEGDNGPSGGELQGHLPDVTVELSVRLHDSPTRANDIAALQVGDVLRLDHRTTDPIRGHVGDSDVLEGQIGRRGRRLALQVTQWRTSPATVLSAAGVPGPAPVALPPDDADPSGSVPVPPMSPLADALSAHIQTTQEGVPHV